MNAVRFLVRGQVQGVFFRASAREEALRLKVTGHARNLADGSVEVVAYGDSTAIDHLEAWLHEGPVQAQVEELYREDIDAGEVPASFIIR
ncbi:acylphosphatase [Luteibacter sp. Sphag1AF]|uniref:acylphosphatase n=1 Tax=Luteibacter sp. Sphag1AF TaxID=2587031 RepID=UPI00160FE2D7|nr:acylphosphatase [Luteibacter sp. Sphag1AF]MBB3225502.1 acylphosphatase [Luteibacter sp. Sphag1AF]